MSGKGSNSPKGTTHRCAPENVPQPVFAGKVTSNNREQHLGRSFPQQNTTVKLATSEVGLRAYPAMPHNPKQAYAQPNVTYGQQMPTGRSTKK